LGEANGEIRIISPPIYADIRRCGVLVESGVVSTVVPIGAPVV
jgi:hypothetical protein